MTKNIYTGCSGFHYNEWKEKFYPEDLPKKQWLSYYAKKFNTVELNSPFYRLPDKADVKKWYKQTPDDFIFTLKGSRYTTHQKKLKYDDALKESVERFYDVAFEFKDKLGCILWQLPGNLHRNDEKLEAFCDLLVKDINNCIEFRHVSWLDDEIYQILEKYNTGFCIVSSPEKELKSIKSTADFSYFRFHGERDRKWYDYDYQDKELKNWAKEMKNTSSDTVYAYFNNDINARAPENAYALMKILD